MGRCFYSFEWRREDGDEWTAAMSFCDTPAEAAGAMFQFVLENAQCGRFFQVRLTKEGDIA